MEQDTYIYGIALEDSADGSVLVRLIDEQVQPGEAEKEDNPDWEWEDIESDDEEIEDAEELEDDDGVDEVWETYDEDEESDLEEV